MLDKTKNNDSELKGAVILAGGDSKRLGQPKALLDFNGRSLIEIMVTRLFELFPEITVVTDRPELYGDLPVRLTGDLLKEGEKSPLRGIHAGLISSTLPYQFMVACDMPFLNLELIKYMGRVVSGYDAVVPLIGRYYQPLYAFYNRSCIDIIEKQLSLGRYRVTELYAGLKIRYISLPEILRFDPDQKTFININTWDDYQRALEIMAGKNEPG